MFLLLLYAVLIASGGGTEIEEVESCTRQQLDVCVDSVPFTPIGLPRTEKELDAHCLAYHTGMTCMDAWIRRCLPNDGQKFLQHQIGGARAVMRLLCSNNTSLRKDFLKESICWTRVSDYWTQCVDDLNEEVKDIAERTQQPSYYSRNGELCCARDSFLMCVADVGRSCTLSGSTLLRRIAFLLVQDVAACAHPPKTYCAASPPPMAAPLLTVIFGIIFYPPRL